MATDNAKRSRSPVSVLSSDAPPLESYRGRRVTVMGLGLFGGGEGAVRFFCERGAQVTVTDLRGEDELLPAIERLDGLKIRWVLGKHREEDLLEADLVVPSPAIPRESDLLRRRAERGLRLDTEMNLFFKYSKGRICAVTGSNGKSTTTRLIGDMAARRWPRTRVGGNLGLSLLPEIQDIAEGEWVVLELSSFQLDDLSALERRPEISVVTNLSPNHLDRHGTFEKYLDAKRRILERGPEPSVAVLNAEDPVARAWSGRCPRRTCFFGRSGSVLPRAEGIWIDEARGEVVRGGSSPAFLFGSHELPLPGRFNRLNAAAAAAAALAMGVEAPEVRAAVRAFGPLEHRLEPVGHVGGVEFVNDSISTTQESTLAALDALTGPLVLICGGARKGTGFRGLAEGISRRVARLILVGATAAEIEGEVRRTRRVPPTHRAERLEEAVALAARLAPPGSRVLLSPACPSYDQFINFAARGDRFKEIVALLRLRNVRPDPVRTVPPATIPSAPGAGATSPNPPRHG